jgi:hypothetical protein
VNTARAGGLAGVTVAAGLAVWFGPLAVSVPGGLLLAFVLPGVAIAAAMFRPGRRDVGVVERLVLVPALSLAVLVLGGLGLWAIGGSLNRAGWLSIAVAVTLVGVATAVARERWLPAGFSWAALSPSSPATSSASPSSSPAPGPAVSDGAGFSWSAVSWPAARRRLVRDVAPLTLAVVLLAGVGWWSLTDSARTYDVTVTSLSAAPPGPVGDDGNRTVQVTATGLAPADGPYRLVLTGSEGEQIRAENLTPGTGGDWTGRLSLPGEERVTVDLFRADESAALRTVIIAAAQ